MRCNSLSVFWSRGSSASCFQVAWIKEATNWTNSLKLLKSVQVAEWKGRVLSTLRDTQTVSSFAKAKWERQNNLGQEYGLGQVWAFQDIKMFLWNTFMLQNYWICEFLESLMSIGLLLTTHQISSPSKVKVLQTCNAPWTITSPPYPAALKKADLEGNNDQWGLKLPT